MLTPSNFNSLFCEKAAFCLSTVLLHVPICATSLLLLMISIPSSLFFLFPSSLFLLRIPSLCSQSSSGSYFITLSMQSPFSSSALSFLRCRRQDHMQPSRHIHLTDLWRAILMDSVSVSIPLLIIPESTPGASVYIFQHWIISAILSSTQHLKIPSKLSWIVSSA